MANASKEMAWPFHIGAHGGVAFVEDPGAVAQQHLVQLVMTRLNERLMLPLYGTVASQYTFENNDDVVAAELSVRLKAAIADWEPGVLIQSVTPAFTNVDDGELIITITFSVPPAPDVFTTVVGMGGNVTGGLGG